LLRTPRRKLLHRLGARLELQLELQLEAPSSHPLPRELLPRRKEVPPRRKELPPRRKESPRAPWRKELHRLGATLEQQLVAADPAEPSPEPGPEGSPRSLSPSSLTPSSLARRFCSFWYITCCRHFS